jgi:hypothetical protein
MAWPSRRHDSFCASTFAEQPDSRFVDIGAGNGDFTAVVCAAAGLEKQVGDPTKQSVVHHFAMFVCLHPSLELSNCV